MDVDSTDYRKAEQTSAILRNWRSSLRKYKNMARIHSMEEQSDGGRTTIVEATEVLNSTAAWGFYERIVQSAEEKAHLSQLDLESATYLLAHAIMINSFQRPGAVINVTMDEFQNAKKETSEGGDVWVVRVHTHKTQVQGSANLILTGTLMGHMNSYVRALRPLVPGTAKSDLLFLKQGGNQLDHMASRVNVLAKRFGFRFVNSTDMRKVIATQATKNIDPEQKRSITKQLSHAAAVDDTYYNLDVHTTRAAVEAYDLVQAAKAGPSKTPQPGPSRDVPSCDVPEPTKGPTKRIPFTTKETKLVEAYFSNVIQKGGTIKMAQAEKFMEQHPEIQRVPKQIVDKVRNLSKYYMDS